MAYYVYLESTKYIPPAETGALAAFEPLSAYFFSVVVMGNRVGPVELVGALCIIVMVCVLTRND
ncbi:EamA family transporter [Acidaminococcus fermentans]|uniref:EamA family transporter n=1 Tax=Acidaminococcus fermentans TaxID=905 RepID=UPI00242B7340|nr:EamA family transporter [Acidaminococcus fermentans]